MKMAQSQYNVHEAKSNLSKLLDRVEKGEIITLARNGKAIARIVAVAPPGLAARGATAAFSAASMWADRARFTTAQAVTRN